MAAVLHEAAWAFVVAAASLDGVLVAVACAKVGAALRLRRCGRVVALESVLAGHCVWFWLVAWLVIWSGVMVGADVDSWSV
jgi:hypothetical protein